MYPGHWSAVRPDHPALVMADTGDTITYGELDDRSRRLARTWYDAGLRPGDAVAVLMENNPRYLEAVWAALRSGLRITPVNRYLAAAEAAYIVGDCGARSLVTSRALAPVAEELCAQVPGCAHRLMVDGATAGFEAYEETLARASAPLEAETLGSLMMYSSGTTGRPKGIARPPGPPRPAEEGFALSALLGPLFAMDGDTVYLSPAPLYHSAPLGFSLAVQDLGGTVVLMRSFDPREALAAVERHRVTHSQWVPTMFSRLLKLPEDVRGAFDLSTHRVAIHAAAPCPRPVKEAMLAWWGPMIHEYYGGSEFNGLTYASPQDWLRHPGTVGRAVVGTLHICDETGRELPPGEPGLVYFEQPGPVFHYHHDEAQTRASEHPDHPTWTALGDIGYVDGEGLLYLTDRSTFMIVSGGVNIYPREVEDCLIMHPLVEDVAVFGVPDPDMGEAVKAVVQPAADAIPGAELEVELIGFARERLSHYKCPRSVDFEAQLPRLPTGKLYKRLLRDRYWAGRESRIV